MKFTADKKYDWIFTSEVFTLVKGDKEMLVRFSYHNMYGFSDYDKSRCAYTGLRANFSDICLEYKTTSQGEAVWCTWEDYEPEVTKKSMMVTINSVMASLKEDSNGWKIKEVA